MRALVDILGQRRVHTDSLSRRNNSVVFRLDITSSTWSLGSLKFSLYTSSAALAADFLSIDRPEAPPGLATKKSRPGRGDEFVLLREKGRLELHSLVSDHNWQLIEAQSSLSTKGLSTRLCRNVFQRY